MDRLHVDITGLLGGIQMLRMLNSLILAIILLILPAQAIAISETEFEDKIHCSVAYYFFYETHKSRKEQQEEADYFKLYVSLKEEAERQSSEIGFNQQRFDRFYKSSAEILANMAIKDVKHLTLLKRRCDARYR